jgi:hypothetical protein
MSASEALIKKKGITDMRNIDEIMSKYLVNEKEYADKLDPDYAKMVNLNIQFLKKVSIIFKAAG